MINDKSTASGISRGRWIKSSYSNASGSCVEVAHVDGTIFVRDSKNSLPAQPILSVAAEQWSAFLGAIPER